MMTEPERLRRSCLPGLWPSVNAVDGSAPTDHLVSPKRCLAMDC